ncbi:MAG: DNA-directed RNA polymerase subunit alpha [Verrucomicrobiota bacterium]|jgi:DNA-directed RNA polymerase subunit alpha|nr:DNA-directed RNA polymerase subunit alpha [Verrucomicrobiota bacterium]MDD8044827.1 DNA-directed RNA polymerase subunit alpha [Verrucomicrobiota bacterium]MDD8049707.1 DNA-directed RNA polymerase subunit alpha [Verrucomicrobiota bacterium]MDI9385761.1 DNA-directed RNA polymerase subunit alpha [Verrucomicrobiota bacterium]HCF95346.1 DNA-directed RNA polymerase subunit alpha [Verrucomicrobiota bacterium]
MAVRLGKFEMPRRLVKDEANAGATYGRFIAEPFEAGYGHTLGNSLRRVLLSSLEGAAISTVRLEGALHEFTHLPGVVEDVTDIVLNLKGVLLRMESREPVKLRIDVKKRLGSVLAKDIITEPGVEVLNGDHIIATLGEEGDFQAELEAKVGRGYLAAEHNKYEGMPISVIPIDCLFSPVRRVRYLVENTRVGQRTDYDKLILDIWTDGRVSPEDALTQASAILRHHLDVFVQFDRTMIEFEEEIEETNEEDEKLRELLNMSVNEIELSVRAANCLNNANITTVGELAQKSESEMLKYRNFGKKSLNEIKDKLADLGMSLGMKFDPSLLETPSAANMGDD